MTVLSIFSTCFCTGPLALNTCLSKLNTSQILSKIFMQDLMHPNLTQWVLTTLYEGVHGFLQCILLPFSMQEWSQNFHQAMAYDFFRLLSD